MPDTSHRVPSEAPATVLAPPLRADLLLRRVVLPLAMRLAERLRLIAPRPPGGGGGVPIGRALGLRHRLRYGLSRQRRAVAAARLRRFPGFDGADYLALNADLRRLVYNPAAHALFHGSCAGRPLFRSEKLARVLGETQVPESTADAPTELATLRTRVPRVGVMVSSHGNVFMQDVADDLAAALAAAGVAVERRDESASPRHLPPFNIVVAPHEFFVLGRGRDWIREDVISASAMLNTEQVQTRWFAQALPFVLASRGVIDLNAQMCALFAETGLPRLQLTLAQPPAGAGLDAADRRHPLFRVLPEAARSTPDPATPFADRVLDIAFFGATTPQRSAFFARNAACFAAYENVLYSRPQQHGPIRGATADGALSRIARHIGGHTRITLNLHRDEFGYFEWHRIVRLGMSMGSVVVSEPCLPHPDFRPGVHYLEAPLRQIPDLIDWLLRSADGRVTAQRVQDTARHLLAERFTAQRNAARLLAFLLDGVAA